MSDSCKDGASKSSTDGVCDVNSMLQNMSTADNKEDEGDNLKSCTACKMVKYCNRECKVAHRPQHKKECRKRAKELHDEELFKQPPPEEDCPICFLRLPTLESGRKYQTCCGKMICSGCTYAPVYDNQGNEVDNQKCPYCRTLWPSSEEEANERQKKRVEAGDARAIYDLACDYREERNGYPQDYKKALELYHQAGELGYAKAHCNIGCSHMFGEGVEVDKKKAIHYFELAAMRGDETARHNLGLYEEEEQCDMKRALKHWILAVRSGHNNSLSHVRELYSKWSCNKRRLYTSIAII